MGVGQFAQNQPGSLQKNGRHIVDFADAAARQYREHRAVFVQFQAGAGGGFIGFHGQFLCQRMPHKQRVATFLTVQFGFHRKQAQHLIDLPHDFLHAAAFPCPHRRRNIMHGGNAGGFELFGHAQIEIGRVNADKHIRPDSFEPRHQFAADFQNFGQALNHFDITAHRQPFLVEQALAAGGNHARAADADELGVRPLRLNRFNQMRAEQIAGSFSGTQGNGQWLGHDGFS